MQAVTAVEAPAIAGPRTEAGVPIGLEVQVCIIRGARVHIALGVQARQVQGAVLLLSTDSMFHAAHLGRHNLLRLRLTGCHLTKWNHNPPVYYLGRNSLCRCSILSWLLIEALSLE